MTCPDCAQAQLQRWPLYQSGCSGCFKRALAELAIPQKPPLPDRQVYEFEEKR
jgi:hypothetical protein